MQGFLPYLNFDGNTREAMTFYHECFGGRLDIQSFEDANIPSPGHENRVMHARLESGAGTLMASDTMPGQPVTPGSNMHITVVCDTIEEIDRLFAAMSDGAQITMPLGEQSWAAKFGMLIDKFGTSWMFNCTLKK